MTPTRPAVAIDGYYNKTQAAAALGVERHTIRRYELAGLLKFKTCMATGRSVVSGHQLLRLWEKMY